MKHYILGTAGHVDHGKTMLVKALTGKDTDRLKEEKERGISIELGFAPLKLPSGNTASIIDVPGHERFIKNMLAGVGGIDMVLFVIAADESIMPQTTEHMDIIQLLQIEQGIVVITKADLVDEDWLQMVHEEVKDFLKGTFMENAPMIDVSVVSGQGIEELRQLIDKMLSETGNQEFKGKTRMPVDRIFSVTGFGTVVTGTMLAGQVSVGDAVEIQPQGLESRIRSLQVHGQKVDKAAAGQRVAVNLAGVEVSDISRGSVLVAPDSLLSSYRLDTEFKLLPGAEKNLANRARIRFHIGTKEALGRIVLLDRDELTPGETALAQFELEEPVVAGKNDRFVVRSYSPLRTIGGGSVIDPNPRKHKRFQEEVLAALKTRQKGTPAELLLQYLLDKNKIIVPLNEINKETELSAGELTEALGQLQNNGEINLTRAENNDFIIPLAIYENSLGIILDTLDKYHQEYPLRPGYPKEEIRSRFFSGVPAKTYNLLLQFMQNEGAIRATDKFIGRQDFKPTPDEEQSQIIRAIENKYRTTGFQPPAWSETAKELKLSDASAVEFLYYLLDKNVLVKMGDDLYLHREVLELGIEKVKGYLQEKGEAALGEIRDLLDTSRKYALPLLEYLDQEKITRRVGDKRVLY